VKQSKKKLLLEFGTASILSLIISICAYAKGLDNQNTLDAVGTYDIFQDKIWIKPGLPEKYEVIAREHEECHRSFFCALPFWKYIKMILSLSPPITIFFGAFVAILWILTGRKKFFLIFLLLYLLVSLPEIHAYGATLLNHGINNLTSPFFSILNFPLMILLIEAILLIFGSKFSRN
jgi:hypothetical protein